MVAGSKVKQKKNQPPGIRAPQGGHIGIRCAPSLSRLLFFFASPRLAKEEEVAYPYMQQCAMYGLDVAGALSVDSLP